MKVKSKLDKRISFLLILVLVVSLVPILSLGAGGENTDSWDQVGKYTDHSDIQNNETVSNPQIDDPVKTTYAGVHELDDLYVKYSKSITGTGVENQFDINLNVETNEKVEEMYVPSNIVLVFDVSGSMNNTVTIGGETTTRWEVFRDAMADFVKKFLDEDSRNNITIAVFGGSASNTVKDTKVIQPWTSKSSVALSSFAGKTISDVRGTIGTYTNGEAGFLAAHDILKNGTKNNQYTSVIFMSDGVFNVSDTVTDSSYYNKTTNAIQNAAIEQAGKLKNLSGCDDIYTFALGEDASVDNNYALISEDKATETQKKNGKYNPHLTTQYNADDSGVETVFENLKKTIQSKVQCWNVTDPMSDWVTFSEDSIKLANGNSGSAIINNNVVDLVKTDNDIISWDLYATKPFYDNTTKTYTYNLTYTVTLDTDAENFPFGEWIATNKQTTISYIYSTDIDTDNPSNTDSRTENFYIPTVKAEDPSVEPDSGQVELSKKVVNAASNATADSDQEFTFNMYYINDPQLTYTGDYDVVTTNNKNTVLKTLNTGEGNDYKGIKLKDGQTAIIKNIIVGETVKFEEIDIPANYTPSWENQNITVSADTSQTATCTNTYGIGKLNVVKTNNPSYSVDGTVNYVSKGDPITYKITATNNGGADLTGVWVKDMIPDYTTYKDDSAKANDNNVIVSAGGVDSVKYVNWFIPTLSAGDSVDLEFTVIVGDGYSSGYEIVNCALYENTGKITPPAITENPKDESNEVKNPTAIKAISVEKLTEDKTLSAGDKVKYTIVLKNTGNVSLDGVKLTDEIPEYTMYVEGSADPTAELKGDTTKYLEWTVGTLDAGKEYKATFEVQLNDTFPTDYIIRNTAIGSVEETDVPSNEVTNPTGKVLPDEANDDDGDGTVKGQVSNDDDDQSNVLGEEAKTSDTTNVMPYLIALLAVAGLTLLIAMRRMTKKEN